MESVLRPEGSLWWERFVKKVGLEPGVKEREREREIFSPVHQQVHVMHQKTKKQTENKNEMLRRNGPVIKPWSQP